MTKNSPSLLTKKMARTANWILLAVLVFLPFHALLTAWFASNFGWFDAVRLWKELLLVLLAVMAITIAIVDQKNYWKKLFETILMKILAGYVLFVGVGAILTLFFTDTRFEAVVYGSIIQLRLVVPFVLAAFFASYDSLIIRNWKKILLVPACLVILFGLLQVSLLSDDFLRHFGYGPDTIPASQNIDAKDAYRRIQSTLRGANPLGAYLVLILSAALVLLRDQKERLRVGLIVLTGNAALWFSFSRSAWLGLTIGLAALSFVYWQKRRSTAPLVVVAVIVVVIGSSIWLLRDNDFVQNTVFHSDETSQSAQSTNAQRLDALSSGVQDTSKMPLGSGVGTAGPASFRNTGEDPRIAENYFLQTGQELGVVGMIWLLTIMVLLARFLWSHRQEDLALVLFVSLIGLAIVNMVSHAWADDTLSILWWGLAGAYYGDKMNKEQTK